MEVDDALEHTHRLVKGAVSIVGGEAILLQEVIANDLRHFERDLV